MKKYLLPIFLFSAISCFAQDTTWFGNATAKAGLSGAKAFRINIVNLNNDDYPDLLLINSQSSISTQAKLSRLYMNIPNPQSSNPADRMFRDVTEGSGIFASNVGDTGRVFSCATMADLNNDGNMDLVTGTYYDRLENFAFQDDRCDVFLGDGQGHFSLVPDNGLNDLGLVNASGFTFLDYDLDGNLDIYIPTWFFDKSMDIALPDILMKGKGDGTFTDVSSQARIDGPSFPMQGASSTDWNNDGLPDILTSAYCRSSGSIWKNNGNGTFTDVAAQAKYSAQVTGDGQPACQWAAQPADFDNDGDMDIAQVLVHGGLDPKEMRSCVYRNQGAGMNYELARDTAIFPRDTPRSSHLGDQDGSWFDMDNDGRLDFALAQCVYMPATDRSYIFRQGENGKFSDVTQEGGLLYLKETHNIRPVDYDLDGDEDILVELWRKNGATVSELHLVENRNGSKNNSVNIKLIAPPGVNRDAVGARITLYSGGTAHIREVQLGQGHFGAQQSTIRTFGLGQNSSIDSVVVRWPSRTVPNTVIYNPPVNQLLRIAANGLVTGVGESGTGASFEISPNPAREELGIRIPENFSSCRLFLYSFSGAEVFSSEYRSTGNVLLPLHGLAPGLYSVRLVSADGKVMSRSFIRE